MRQTPVPALVFAFANDRSAGGRFLSGLPDESRQIRDALEAAEEADLCKIAIRGNATIEDLFRLLQRRSYRNRVAVFHFAGHAGSAELLFETEQGDASSADAAGIAQFLGQQKGLHLVFLNGCSSADQVAGLLEAGVAAVIATSQEIDDVVATAFAARFYRGLGSGATIRAAFNEAEAEARATLGDDPSAAFKRGSAPEDDVDADDADRTKWPWKLHVAEGDGRDAEPGQWSLPGAAGEPLTEWAAVTNYAELEVTLQPLQRDSYRIGLRYSDPGNAGGLPSQSGECRLDLGALGALGDDPEAYGGALTAAVFSDPRLSESFREARSAAEVAGLELRVRLSIDARELHSVHWELLREPESERALASCEGVILSRYTTSRRWQAVRLQPKGALEGLLALAAPGRTGESDSGLRSLRNGLERLAETDPDWMLLVAGDREPLSVDGLMTHLRTVPDVLCLVCDCRTSEDRGSYVRFADGAEGTTEIGVAAFADRVRLLPRAPRLIVVVDGSGGKAHGGPVARMDLAARLAEAGVPATVTTQGAMDEAVLWELVLRFLAELLKDGQVDRALRSARSILEPRGIEWAPSLYLRLSAGRLWYEPGFMGREEEFSRWPSLVDKVRRGSFVPILGPEIGDLFYGSSGERAAALAETHDFPLAEHERTDLAKVAQYLSVTHGRVYARDEIQKQLKRLIAERHEGLDEGAGRLFTAALDEHRDDRRNPYRVLAGLDDAAIYVTACIDPLLQLALSDAGRDPQSLFSRWRKTRSQHPREPEYEGTPDSASPLVYHPYGVLKSDALDSLVLTEDDLLDFLIAAADYNLIPTAVRGALVRSSLIFLGFHLDDLAFRVLFRLIMSLDGAGQLADHRPHVGVQLDPEQHQLADLERARHYFKDYFGGGPSAPKVEIYWGGAADFLNELEVRLAETPERDISIDGEDDDEWE